MTRHLCRACRTLLHPALRRMGQTIHPLCLPLDRPWPELRPVPTGSEES